MATPDLVPVLAQLKVAKPDSLNVELADGAVKSVAIPTVRRKWQHLKAVLANLGDWKRIEGVDKRGACLVVINNDAIDEPEDEFFEDISGDPGNQTATMLSLMLKAQDVALTRQHQMVRTVLESQNNLLKLVSERIVAQEKASHAQFARMQEYAEALAEASAAVGAEDAGGDGEVLALLQALPALIGAGKNGAPGRPAKAKK